MEANCTHMSSLLCRTRSGDPTCSDDIAQRNWDAVTCLASIWASFAHQLNQSVVSALSTSGKVVKQTTSRCKQNHMHEMVCVRLVRPWATHCSSARGYERTADGWSLGSGVTADSLSGQLKCQRAFPCRSNTHQ